MISQCTLTAPPSKTNGADPTLSKTTDGAVVDVYDHMAGGTPTGVTPTENMMFPTWNVLPGGGHRDGAWGDEKDITGEGPT